MWSNVNCNQRYMWGSNLFKNKIIINSSKSLVKNIAILIQTNPKKV